MLPSDPATDVKRAAPKTQLEWFREIAAEAMTAGIAAIEAGDTVAATQWLGRAHRIAPKDPSITLALAGQQLRVGAYAEAARLLESLSEAHDLREIWPALALARRATGDHAGAAAALAAGLGGHVMTELAGLAPLARIIAADAGLPGWCGLHAQDGLTVEASGAAPSAGEVRVKYDAGPWRPWPGPAWRIPAQTARIEVAIAGARILGSPVDRRRAIRVEGVVAVEAGGLVGWAWHPGDPDTPPVLTIRPAAGGRGIRVIADDTNLVSATPLARPRGFSVSFPLPKALHGALRVTAPDPGHQEGRDLLGSPLDPSADFSPCARTDHPKANAPLQPDRRVAVVIPVYAGLRQTLDCLDAVFATVPARTRIVVVDDATPDPALAEALDDLQRRRRITLVRHLVNGGFPRAANAGMRAAASLPGRPDIVLLNSDTVVAAGWVEGLRAVVHGRADIGTATPFSNDATILSYPDAARGNPVPADVGAIAALAARAVRGRPEAVEIPTAVGFCMYIRRECLAATGLFREDVFAQGYGEENDFCLRARAGGWRHVAAPGVFVAHIGSQSFGGARAALITRNMAVLERLHPGYAAEIAAFQEADQRLQGPVALARRRLDMERWRTERRAAGRGNAVIIVTHDMGGGVERVVARRCGELRAQGLRPIVLRPILSPAPVARPPDRKTAQPRDAADASADTRETLPDMCQIREASGREASADGFNNLWFRVPGELNALTQLLRGDRPIAIELHHLLGHHPDILRIADALALPIDVHVHDYASFCPRITLATGEGRYCGEPAEAAACEACIAAHGRRDDDTVGIAALRKRSRALFAQARRIVVPSNDMAARLRRHFKGLAPSVAALEDDAADAFVAHRLHAPSPATPRHICVIGAIGRDKGYDVLLACAEDAAARDLPLRFTVAGHTIDDASLMRTGRVFVTGPYREADGVALVGELKADLAWLPSIWPETWSFTLAVAWHAGLEVVAFDLGAPAERIKATGRGWCLPLGLPSAAINNTLLALRRDAGD